MIVAKLSEMTRVGQAEYLREALDQLLQEKEYQAILRKAAR
jgi:Ribbon-helix-helix domain